MSSFPVVRIKTFFTFNIPGLEKEANEMAIRNNVQSTEERMALAVGYKAEQMEINRKLELAKRLNREAVLYRKKLIAKTKNRSPLINSILELYEEPIKMNQIPLYDNNAMDLYQNVEQCKNESKSLEWRLYPIEVITSSFSWHMIVENWRSTNTDVAAVESTSSLPMILPQQQHEKLQHCEITENMEETIESQTNSIPTPIPLPSMSFLPAPENSIIVDRPITPPLPAFVKKQRRSIKNKQKRLSLLNENTTTPKDDVIIILDEG